MGKILAVVLTIGVTMITEAKPFNTELEAIALIAKHEGFRPTPYLCQGQKWSIGYGFTDKELVAKGKITRAEADRQLGIRVRKEIVWVKKTFPKLSDRQLVAIVSLAFNTGHDTLLYKKVNGKRVHTDAYLRLIAGDYEQAAKEIAEFRLANGKVSNGLIKRRADEIRYLIG